MRIYLWGQRNLLGTGVHFTAFANAMKRLPIYGGLVEEVDVFGAHLEAIAEKSCEDDVHILFSSISRPLKLRGKVVKWGVFEATRLDSEYLSYLKASHLIWVPSQWAREVLIENGVDAGQIAVVREGVDPMIFNPSLRQAIKKDDVFRFYMCGKYEARKGFDELLGGFSDAFKDDPKTQLYLKADHFAAYAHTGHRETNLLQQKISALGLKNVRIISGQYSNHDLALFCNYCDVLVMPTRSEGWGLPLIEGIACGMPTITNFFSGQTEYLSEIKHLVKLLDYELQPVKVLSECGSAAHGANWAVASSVTISEAMQAVKENIGEWRQRAKLASDTVRTRFTWEKSIDQALESMDQKGVFKLSVELGLNDGAGETNE